MYFPVEERDRLYSGRQLSAWEVCELTFCGIAKLTYVRATGNVHSSARAIGDSGFFVVLRAGGLVQILVDR